MSTTRTAPPSTRASRPLTEREARQFLTADARAPARVGRTAPTRLSDEDLAALNAGLRDRLGDGVEPLEAGDGATLKELVDLTNARAEAEVVRGSAQPQVRTTKKVGGELPGRRGPRAKPAAEVARSRGSEGPQVRTTKKVGGELPGRRGPRAKPAAEVARPGAPAPGSQGKRIKPDLRAYHPDLERSDAVFRRQRRAVGKLVGSELKQVVSAYTFAYILCGSARNELRSIEDQPRSAHPALWHAWRDHPEATLGHWFGATVPERGNLTRTLDRVREVLEAWTSGFSGGFGTGFPVFIRRKETDPVFGDPPARHVARNTIELMPDYFDLGQETQTLILLHEMGHWAIGATNPRDERSSLCSGGWNRKNNMCYIDKYAITSESQVFREGNPRALAIAFDDGNTKAKTIALNNIDNYVAYMWNRYLDRDKLVVHVPPSGSSRSTPPPGSTGKPIGSTGKPSG